MPAFIHSLAAFFVCILWIDIAQAAQCMYYRERQVIDGLVGMDASTILMAARDLDTDTSQIRSGEFYNGLANWVLSLPHENPGAGDTALAEMGEALQTLEQQYESEQTAAALLSWGLASAHTARMMLVSKRPVDGVKLASAAITSLQSYLELPGSNKQGRAAASFAIGLYYIYSNAIPPEFSWSSKFIAPAGTADQGRVLLENTIRSSSVLSPEAARTLLLETPWQTPRYCDYLQISRQMVNAFPDNPDLSIGRQALLLRCGHPQLALDENSRFQGLIQDKNIRGYYSENYSRLLKQGYQRALADSGNTVLLELNRDRETLDHFHKYALANAMDVAGNRPAAIKIYQQLANDPEAPNSIRTSARIRLKLPYSPPETIHGKRSLSITTCSND